MRQWFCLRRPAAQAHQEPRRQASERVTTSVSDFLAADGTGELHVSTISDVITLLHYVPVGGELRRGVQVLKIRGSNHDKSIREFHITGHGMEIGDPFPDVSQLF